MNSLWNKKTVRTTELPSMSILATSGAQVHDMKYYLTGALAGGICCGVTHGALCPVDVVKTRIQLDSVKYNKGLIGGFGQIIGEEGIGALASGLGPTVFGYFIQGWFKFGGVEFFKIKFVENMDPQTAWDRRQPIYLASAAMAEFIADIFLCPLEATRIKLVKDPSFASSMPDAFSKIMKAEGFLVGFYSGFGPILFKQIPYTMAKFSVQGACAERIYGSMGTSPEQCSDGKNISISLASGVVAGVASAIISHPADTLLSKVNVPGAGGEGGIMVRLGRIAGEIGFMNLALTGLAPRCVMIGSLTAFQFGIFDTVMGVLGASKYHFHNPAEEHH
jgi:solute carrier family 25 phosphate transporter 3